MTRGLKNTFRFGPGFGVIAKTAIDNLVTINDQAGKIAKTVMIVHEDSAFGSGLAKLLERRSCPEAASRCWRRSRTRRRRATSTTS